MDVSVYFYPPFAVLQSSDKWRRESNCIWLLTMLSVTSGLHARLKVGCVWTLLCISSTHRGSALFDKYDNIWFRPVSTLSFYWFSPSPAFLVLLQLFGFRDPSKTSANSSVSVNTVFSEPSRVSDSGFSEHTQVLWIWTFRFEWTQSAFSERTQLSVNPFRFQWTDFGFSKHIQVSWK